MNTQTPRFTGRALYGRRMCNTIMTRKDQMREGYVSRNFHIPIDVDERLRIEAVKKQIRFSDIATLAFEQYLQNTPKVTK